jgi:hypothetical protein
LLAVFKQLPSPDCFTFPPLFSVSLHISYDTVLLLLLLMLMLMLMVVVVERMRMRFYATPRLSTGSSLARGRRLGE